MAELTYKVIMYKDGTYTCELDPRNEIEQNTMELEYIVPEGSTYDPNEIRSNPDPEYFYTTPARPVIWSWVKVNEVNSDGTVTSTGDQIAQAVAKANLYRNTMISSGKWDLVVAAYKQQYNIIEV